MTCLTHLDVPSKQRRGPPEAWDGCVNQGSLWRVVVLPQQLNLLPLGPLCPRTASTASLLGTCERPVQIMRKGARRAPPRSKLTTHLCDGLGLRALKDGRPAAAVPSEIRVGEGTSWENSSGELPW